MDTRVHSEVMATRHVSVMWRWPQRGPQQHVRLQCKLGMPTMVFWAPCSLAVWRSRERGGQYHEVVRCGGAVWCAVWWDGGAVVRSGARRAGVRMKMVAEKCDQKLEMISLRRWLQRRLGDMVRWKKIFIFHPAMKFTPHSILPLPSQFSPCVCINSIVEMVASLQEKRFG